MKEQESGRLKQLMDSGKEKFALYDDVNEVLTEDMGGSRDLDDVLSDLHAQGVPVVMIAGNHDGAERLSPMAAEEQALLASSQQAVPQSSAGHPLVRLACHAMPTGDVTLVLKP